LFKTRAFLLISYQFLLIFTLIFELKTNKSYKITLFSIANHSIFQKNVKNPYFLDFLSFSPPFFPSFVIKVRNWCAASS